jgi:hypothetical protein
MQQQKRKQQKQQKHQKNQQGGWGRKKVCNITES